MQVNQFVCPDIGYFVQEESADSFSFRALVNNDIVYRSVSCLASCCIGTPRAANINDCFSRYSYRCRLRIYPTR